MKLILVLTGTIIISLLLVSCSSVMTVHRDSQGKVWKVETRGNAKTTIETWADGHERYEQDSKSSPLIELPPIQPSMVTL